MSTIALLGTIETPIGILGDPLGSKNDPNGWTKTSPPATQSQTVGRITSSEAMACSGKMGTYARTRRA